MVLIGECTGKRSRQEVFMVMGIRIGKGRGGTARSLRCATFLLTNLLNGDGGFA